MVLEEQIVLWALLYPAWEAVAGMQTSEKITFPAQKFKLNYKESLWACALW